MQITYKIVAYNKHGEVMGCADHDNIYTHKELVLATLSSYHLFRRAGLKYFGLEVNGITVAHYICQVAMNEIGYQLKHISTPSEGGI
tara:strand:- start:2034 stop:2294 length:261 start_codon:yes stop_codon:yes gene_type:complete